MIGRNIYGVIYCIKILNNEILYIGNTRRVEDVSKRYSEHMREIKRHKHKYISYDEYENGLKYEVLCLIYSDSFIIEMVENLYNSLYQPRNEVVSNGTTYKRCSCEDADKTLRGMDSAYVICRLDTLDVEGKTEILMNL